MNKRSLGGLLIVLYVAMPLTRARACNLTPVAQIYDYVTHPTQWVCVGDTVALDGSMSYDTDGTVVLWEWDVWYYDEQEEEWVKVECPTGEQASFEPNDPGKYCIELWVKDNDEDYCKPADTDWCTVYAVEVAEVVKFSSGESGPLYTCLDGEVVLEAKSNVSGPFPDANLPTWQIIDTDPGGLTATLEPYGIGGGLYLAYLDEFSGPGDYVIEAKCGDSDPGDNTITVTVVGVDKLQYDDPLLGYTDVPETLNVHQGTSVTFKAIPYPSGASWPTGKPVWKGEASGTGPTTSVTFDTLSTSTSDYNQVTAECGNEVTANVIVYSFQGILVPDIIFDGRTYEEYGVEETVSLGYFAYPSGITALPVEWKVDSGVGSIVDEGSTYDAGAIPGDVDLKLEIISGPSKGRYSLASKTVVAPIDRYIRHRTETGVRHYKGSHSVKFKMEYFLDPKNVSFTNIRVREGNSTEAEGTGVFASQDGYIHPVGDPTTPSNPNVTTGCYVGEDETGFDLGPGLLGESGTFSNYFINLEYIGDDDVYRPMGTIESAKKVEVNGNSKAKKGSLDWVTAHLDDDDSYY